MDKDHQLHKKHRERMRNRYLREGSLNNFEDHNALEMLLYYSIPRADTNELAHRLINRFHGLDHVFEASVEELMEVEGVGENTALLIRLTSDLERKRQFAALEPRACLKTVEEQARFLEPYFYSLTVETSYLVCLDAQKRVITCEKISEGDALSEKLNIRRVIDKSSRRNVAYVLLAHNHPRGISVPSTDDMATSKWLIGVLQNFGVKLLDHLIFGSDGYSSMAEKGFI